MVALLDNTQTKTTVVDSIDDVSGPVLLSPAAYPVGWRAVVRSAVPSEQGRVFVVIQDASSGFAQWMELITAGSVPTPLAVTQKFSFSVPTAGSSIDAQTVNFAVPTDEGADEFRVEATYEPGFVLQPNAGAGLFQYATFLLIDPGLLSNGRLVTVINTGNPDVATRQSSIALRLPDGSSSRINYRRSDMSIHQNLSAGQYIILQAGGAVQMSVDRSDPSTARYLLRSLL